MERFFNPRSIVIFGASANPNKGGNQVLRNIIHYSRKNEITHVFIIHPKRDEIEGVKCYRTLAGLREVYTDPIDLAILVVPVNAVLPIVKECIEFGVRGILIESGKLVEDEDTKLSESVKDEIRKLMKGSDTRIVGPNALGFYNPAVELTTSLGSARMFLARRDRNVSLCGQSGLFVTGFIYQFEKSQPFGISKSCAIGNKFDVNEGDILEYYLNDPDTDIIGMYLEDIRDGLRFKAILDDYNERLKEGNADPKPMVMLKAGKSERAKKAIVSHTGSLAGNYRVFEGLAKQYNIILVESYSELFDCLSILAQLPGKGVRGDRIGVISISGSGCVLASDYAEKYRLNLPEISDTLRNDLRELFPSWAPLHNPIDTWVSIEKVGDYASYNGILDKFIASGEYDIIVIATIGSAFARFDFDHLAAVRRNYPEIPIILHAFGGYLVDSFRKRAHERGLSFIDNFERIFMLLAKIAEYSRKTRLG